LRARERIPRESLGHCFRIIDDTIYRRVRIRRSAYSPAEETSLYRFWQRIDPATPHRGHFERESVEAILKITVDHGSNYAEGGENPRESGGHSGEARAGIGTLCQLQGGGTQQAGQARGLPSLSGTYLSALFS